MAVILEQDSIDALVAKQTRTDNSISAKEKIAAIYRDATGMALEYDLVTLDDIGSVIDLIDPFIGAQSEYIDDFKRLKRSYELKTSRN